jgi:hypothetical protein
MGWDAVSAIGGRSDRCCPEFPDEDVDKRGEDDQRCGCARGREFQSEGVVGVL